MRNTIKIIFSLILLGSTSLAALGNTLFTITPSVTNLNLSSNGSSSVMYTVTNNASISTTLSITPNYKSSGSNLTIASNTCTGVLSSNASCTFRIFISGSNQPASFTITPKVCGFNGFICSVSSSTAVVIVNRSASGLPTRAYEEVTNNNSLTTTLLGININNTSDKLSFNLNYTSNVNSVVVSPDGSKVYAVQRESGGNASVAIFNVTSDSLILNRVVTLSGVSLRTAPAYNMQMALTPDGSTLFIIKYRGVGLRPSDTFSAPLPLFRIDLTSDASVATVIADPDHIIRGVMGLIVSPDSKTLYVGTNSDYIVAMPVNAVSVNSSNIIVQGSIPADNHIGLAMDPAGNKLFVGNQASGSVSILAVNGMQANFEETILNNGAYSGTAGLVVSPDGETLYVAQNYNNSVLSVPLNDPDMTIIQSGIVGAFGLSLSPNGSKLYVTQSENGINTTTVINTANFVAPPSIISIDGSSLTIGKFIG